MRMDTEDVRMLNIQQVFIPRKGQDVKYIILPYTKEVGNKTSEPGHPSIVKYILPELYPRYTWLKYRARAQEDEVSIINIMIGTMDLDLRSKAKRYNAPAQCLGH